MFPPNWVVLPQIIEQVLLTIQLAFISTVLATVIAFPVSFLCAENIVGRGWIYTVTRFFLNADRSIDTLIFALIFVSAVGLGPFAGTLALATHSIGMLGKLFSEAIEGVASGPIEALKSVGARKVEIIRWAIIPQVIPNFISYFLYRFEINIRIAVVLGLVGAGGIGFLLQSYMRLFLYKNVSVVIITILLLVMSIDFICAKLRRFVL